MATGFQRIESLFIFALACAVYYHFGFSWIMFFVLILAPDIFFAGYLINSKIGARIYNVGHIYAAPVILLSLHYLAGVPQALPISIIWAAHIAFDRMLGFGLKYESGFRDTHLGKLNLDSEVERPFEEVDRIIYVYSMRYWVIFQLRRSWKWCNWQCANTFVF